MTFRKSSNYINTILMTIFLVFICTFVMHNEVSADMLNDDAFYREKIIYLTFDDGPSDIITNRVLNILKEKRVKATFFVVGTRIQGRESILKRMVRDGHSIGLHSYTHNYKKIYSSSNVFIKEMDDTRYKVKKVAGINSNIIRFPSGSKPYLSGDLLSELHKKNYKVFDWNAALSDGLKPYASPSMFVKESAKVYGRNSRVILLMHCGDTNVKTCIALPRIIDYYKQKGYVFKVISNITPEFYF